MPVSPLPQRPPPCRRIRTHLSTMTHNASYRRMELPQPARGLEAADLITRLRAGDADAFESLVREQTPRLLRVARRFMRNEEEARDAVQDAFISVFRSVRSFGEQSLLSTWLHRIVVNACLMRLRAQKRRGEDEDIEQLLPKFREDGHQLERSVRWEAADSQLERTERCNLVRACIDRLPESYRAVLLLRDIEELDTEETAEILQMTPNAVKVRLHRARQALRTLLDPHMRSVR